MPYTALMSVQVYAFDELQPEIRRMLINARIHTRTDNMRTGLGKRFVPEFRAINEGLHPHIYIQTEGNKLLLSGSVVFLFRSEQISGRQEWLVKNGKLGPGSYSLSGHDKQLAEKIAEQVQEKLTSYIAEYNMDDLLNEDTALEEIKDKEYLEDGEEFPTNWFIDKIHSLEERIRELEEKE